MPASSDVRHEALGRAGGRWFVVVDGHECELTYSSRASELITLDHTGVPDAMRGRGVGAMLVRRAVEDARADGFKIVPQCSFAQAQFDRHEDWGDVLAT